MLVRPPQEQQRGPQEDGPEGEAGVVGEGAEEVGGEGGVADEVGPSGPGILVQATASVGALALGNALGESDPAVDERRAW